MICETIRNHYFLFFQSEFTNCFIIQSVSFVCFVIQSILMPKTQITLAKLGPAQSIFFLLDVFAFPKSFFLYLGINSALFLAGRGFRKIAEVQEVHFKAFHSRWAHSKFSYVFAATAEGYQNYFLLSTKSSSPPVKNVIKLLSSQSSLS